MTRPHIVHVYKDYWPPVLGGIERSINWMVRGLSDRFDFTVLVNARGRIGRERSDGPIRIIEVPEWGRLLSAPVSPAFPGALRKVHADLFHFHIPNPTGDVAWQLAGARGPVVATWHSDVVRQKWAMTVYRPLLRRFLRRCAVIMPTSPRLVECTPLLQEVRDHCEPVPLGLPQSEFQPTGALAAKARAVRKRFGPAGMMLFVGKLRYYKGLHFAIGALREVPNAQLVLIGDGTERGKLLALARELGVADRVHFEGELPDEEVVPYLHACDFFVMPSHLSSEAFGLSQVEAMACGKPVLCCNLPTGVPWVTQHGVTGIVVPPADEAALARGMRELLADGQRRFQMGEAALRRARELFSQEAMCAHLGAIYDRVLSGGTR